MTCSTAYKESISVGQFRHMRHSVDRKTYTQRHSPHRVPSLDAGWTLTRSSGSRTLQKTTHAPTCSYHGFHSNIESKKRAGVSATPPIPSRISKPDHPRTQSYLVVIVMDHNWGSRLSLSIHSFYRGARSQPTISCVAYSCQLNSRYTVLATDCLSVPSLVCPISLDL